MLFFILNLFLITALSFGQLGGLFTVAGIQVNLVLVCTIVFSIFEKDWFKRLLLIILASVILSFGPSLDFDTLSRIIILVVSVILLDVLRWERLINAALIIPIATILSDMQILNRGDIIFREIIWNLTAMALLVLVITLFERRLEG
jgi:hypothetical protein